MHYKKYLSGFAGLIFGVAWFLWIDGHVYENTRLYHEEDYKGPTIQWIYYLPGIFATLALVMSNIVHIESLSSSSFLTNEDGVNKIRIWLFISFAISFGCVAASIWIMAGVFMPPHNTNTAAQWPGIALMLQNILIFISSLILVYSKTHKDEDEFQPF
ncbi:transmembrane protein [Tieghemostelium lacteum]|uniref:Transmembrane protein n=1 Tax=Tieghemostelium lacteum TaxID=361077 RepID=A0A151Z6J4_TIELA|nr:transmembrane protein [Tieghemostelium lacteum]|eukprot:KYQ89558.1 transmembrane protein [Tieghemostelium lacteum]